MAWLFADLLFIPTQACDTPLKILRLRMRLSSDPVNPMGHRIWGEHFIRGNWVPCERPNLKCATRDQEVADRPESVSCLLPTLVENALFVDRWHNAMYLPLSRLDLSGCFVCATFSPGVHLLRILYSPPLPCRRSSMPVYISIHGLHDR